MAPSGRTPHRAGRRCTTVRNEEAPTPAEPGFHPTSIPHEVRRTADSGASAPESAVLRTSCGMDVGWNPGSAGVGASSFRTVVHLRPARWGVRPDGAMLSVAKLALGQEAY